MFETGKEYLRKSLITSQVPNTMLFFDADLPTLKKHALELSASLLKSSAHNHPDFHTLSPEGKSALHSIESIRAAIDTSHISPFQAPSKVFLIESAERMQPAAANALLKTLEEPTLDSYWILLAPKTGSILPTILSRCIQLSFASDVEMSVADSEEVLILRSLLKEQPTYPKLALALEKIEKRLEGEESQSKALTLFTEISLYWREEAQKGGDLPDWEDPLQEAMLGYERNIKLSTCLEVFFFKVFKNS